MYVFKRTVFPRTKAMAIQCGIRWSVLRSDMAIMLSAKPGQGLSRKTVTKKWKRIRKKRKEERVRVNKADERETVAL